LEGIKKYQSKEVYREVKERMAKFKMDFNENWRKQLEAL